MNETPVATALLRRAAREIPKIRRRLHGAFPRASEPDLDDAVQHAFMVAVEHPETFRSAHDTEGDHGLRWLVMIGWRFLRGEFRRFAVKKTDALPDRDAIADPRPSPAVEVESRAEVRRVETLVDRAASMHGAACEERLREALLDRICDEDTDANAARRHGVPREYVNRARRWIAEQLRAP